MEDASKWTIEKKIPLLSMITGAVTGAVMIIGQTWYLSSVLSEYRYRIASLEEFVKTSQPQAAQIAVMQEKIASVQTSINRIEGILVRPDRHGPDGR